MWRFEETECSISSERYVPWTARKSRIVNFVALKFQIQVIISPYNAKAVLICDLSASVGHDYSSRNGAALPAGDETRYFGACLRQVLQSVNHVMMVQDAPEMCLVTLLYINV